jgi:hypothetical protein
MPRGFGAAGGPRQAPDDEDFQYGPTKFARYIVGFHGRADQVSALLPAGLALRGDPVVQFHFFCLRDIPWLAGRGYNILSVLVPVRHESPGGNEAIDGLYQAVLWENLADSIMTGREQLGHPKLYADLPEPRRWNGVTYLRAGWGDFTFAEFELSGGVAAGPETLANVVANAGAGIISHKYIPRTGRWDEADADYLTLSPMPGESDKRDPQPAPAIEVGAGRVRFHTPTWQDMPTQYHIIRKLAALEQSAPLEAVVLSGTTHLDLFDQRILA